MNPDKQIDKLHDALREIIDPEGFGWINRSTEVVIDDLIMGGVEFSEKREKTPCNYIEKCEMLLEIERAVKRKLERKLAKAEHDRDRYAAKIKELETEDKKWREMWADNQKQWEVAYDKLEYEVRADTVREIQNRLVLHFGTYTDKTEVKMLDVFRLLDQIAEDII